MIIWVVIILWLLLLNPTQAVINPLKNLTGVLLIAPFLKHFSTDD